MSDMYDAVFNAGFTLPKGCFAMRLKQVKGASRCAYSIFIREEGQTRGRNIGTLLVF